MLDVRLYGKIIVFNRLQLLIRASALADAARVGCGRMTASRENHDCLRDCQVVQALASLQLGFVLTNGAGNVTWLNRKAADVLGQPPAACLTRPLAQLLRDVHLAAFWHQAVEAGGDVVAEVALRWPAELTLRASVTRLNAPEADETGFVLLLCDVTAERRISVELSEAIGRRLLSLAAGDAPTKAAQGLTGQELRILGLVGHGKANNEIGVEIGVTTSTVRSHLKSIYRKLGIESRAEAVSFAVRNQLG